MSQEGRVSDASTAKVITILPLFIFKVLKFTEDQVATQEQTCIESRIVD